MSDSSIVIRGAREHNLRVMISIQKNNKLWSFTGLVTASSLH